MRAARPAQYFLSALLCAAATVPSFAQQTNPQVAKLLAQAADFEKREQLTSAVDSYRAANKAAGGRCIECLQPLFALQMRMPVYKDAAATAAQLEAAAPDAASKAAAELSRARALVNENEERPKRSILEDANKDLIDVETNAPANTDAVMLRGRVLALLDQNEAASKEFLAYAKLLPPDNPLAARARHFAEDPALARKHLAPDFTLVTQDGKPFSLAQAVGKVVMIDFWATWCGPCREELSYVQEIAEDFQGKDFIMLSVSWDHSSAEWASFTKRNKMTWPQYRDADEVLTQSFAVSAIPTYILIDRDGVIRSKAVGGMLDIRSDVKDLIAGKSIPADTESAKKK